MLGEQALVSIALGHVTRSHASLVKVSVDGYVCVKIRGLIARFPMGAVMAKVIAAIVPSNVTQMKMWGQYVAAMVGPTTPFVV